MKIAVFFSLLLSGSMIKLFCPTTFTFDGCPPAVAEKEYGQENYIRSSVGVAIALFVIAEREGESYGIYSVAGNHGLQYLAAGFF